jgi:hypothetical protein
VLTFAYLPEIPTVVRPGAALDVSIHVHDLNANNFNWTGYTPKASIKAGEDILATVNGTVVSAGGGTASFAWTSAQTALLGELLFCEMQIWADNNSSTENLQIGNLTFQTGEAIP